MAKQIDPSEITEERSLWDIYKQARKVPQNTFNTKATLIVVLVLAVFGALTSASNHQLAEQVRAWTDMVLGFSVNILGFLLAGFTIFATMNRPEMFVEMVKREHPTGLSYLKYSFFAFMEVFIEYVSFVVICVLIKLACWPGGPLPSLIHLLPSSTTWARLAVVIGFVLVGSGAFRMVMVLKSFIFNVYHIVMTGIQWDFIQPILKERAAQKAAREAAALTQEVSSRVVNDDKEEEQTIQQR